MKGAGGLVAAHMWPRTRLYGPPQQFKCLVLACLLGGIVAAQLAEPFATILMVVDGWWHDTFDG